MRGHRTHELAAAYHEAGHALGALKVRRQVIRLELDPARPGNGRTIHWAFQRNPFQLGDGGAAAAAAWQYSLTTTRDSMTILLAGPLAEARLLRCPLRDLGSRSDLESCMALARRIELLANFAAHYTRVEPIDGDALMNQVSRQVRRWVGHAQVWPLIESVAVGLVSRYHLDHQAFYELIDAAKRKVQGAPGKPGTPVSAQLFAAPDGALPPDPDPADSCARRFSAAAPESMVDAGRRSQPRAAPPFPVDEIPPGFAADWPTRARVRVAPVLIRRTLPPQPRG